MKIKLTINLTVFLLFISMNVRAEVKPPNYDFSLDALKVFYPGSTRAAIKEKFGDGEKYETQSGVAAIKYYVAHIRYKFPVFVQFKGDDVVDFYARLPSYFLHDVFHQSMINRYGKQDQYFKRKMAAIYIWNNKDGIKFYYSGQCTITCFPMYLSGISVDAGGVVPLIKQFNLNPLPPMEDEKQTKNK